MASAATVVEGTAMPWRYELVRRLSFGFVGLAAAALCYRFFNRPLCAFIMDEPHFLTAARQQVLTGHWVSAAPIADCPTSRNARL